MTEFISLTVLVKPDQVGAVYATLAAGVNFTDALNMKKELERQNSLQPTAQLAEDYYREQTSDDVQGDETIEETAPAPKRRGRPAKAKVEDTGTTESITEVPVEATATLETVTEAEVVQTGTVSEDDEFAAFASAAAEVQTAGEEAKAAIPARKWTDADLGSLCNQAAVKLGDPAPVKALIAEFVEADEVPHSRNIPAEKREDFAAAVEAKADIKFA